MGITLRRSVVTAAFGAVVVLVGIAVATIPGPDGTIGACYQKRKGTVRLVDEGGRCKKSEVPIAWSQGVDAFTKAESDARYVGTEATAANATRVGGIEVRSFSYRANADMATAQVVAIGGLVLAANCLNDAGSRTIGLLWNTSIPDAVVQRTAITGGNLFSDGDFDFDPGDTTMSAQVTAATQGQVAYTTPAGAQVIVDWHAIGDRMAFGGTQDCVLGGIAFHTPAP